MRADTIYCASHYLAFRYIADECKNFFPQLRHRNIPPLDSYDYIATVEELDSYIAERMQGLDPSTTGVLLSGGIDSAVVASYLPRGARAFTMLCVAGDSRIDESAQARIYAEAYGLEHIIVPITWEEILARLPCVFEFNGVPPHSIELLLDIALSYAKSLGVSTMCVGESFDLVFGGMDRLLSKDWGFEEFVRRYTFLEPARVLREWVDTREVFEPYRLGEGIDFLRFIDEVFAIESSTSYWHSFNRQAMGYLDPCQRVKMARPLDLARVRNGEPKYMVRELFARRYPGVPIPAKIPMPREVGYWLRDYVPKRREFIAEAVGGLSGDQKWQVFVLEKFLNHFSP